MKKKLISICIWCVLLFGFSWTVHAASYASYTGVDYTALTNNPKRIAALKKAQQMVTVRWTCPVNFVTWSSSAGSYNTVTATDGTSSTSFIAGKTYQGIPYCMIAGKNEYDDIKWK